jgi:hypothetical protein
MQQIIQEQEADAVAIEDPDPGDEKVPDHFAQVIQNLDAGLGGAGGEYGIRAPMGYGVVITRHTDGVRADVVQRGDRGVNAMHLLQTDNDVQAVMGAVHMVRPGAHYGDKHFMHDMDGDINQGQRIMVEKSRKGPFREQSGRSTVMDSSAHVVYRKRAGAFEITVRRGAIQQEFQQLLNKLQMHRLSAFGSYVTIIKGNKRYRLGKLSDVSLRQLQELIEECIDQYGTCGIEVTESGGQAGSGGIYHGSMHKSRFKAKVRRGAGPMH